jgi:UDP-galactopyranose mutase
VVTSSPAFQNPDVLCFSHLRWDFVFQRPQHLMERWAKRRRVFYVEEPIRDGETPHLEVRPSTKGVYVVTPHVPASAEDTTALERELLDQLLVDHQIVDFIAWYYTPMAVAWSSHLPARAVVYDCMDELSGFAGASPLLRERERELFGLADVVFTGGHHLYQAKREQHDDVHPLPSSVDVPHFGRARSIVEEPADQADIPHPRLGFYGVLDERLDTALIAGLADRRPGWHIVLVGPVCKIDPASLPRRSNIHYLGPKTYDELPVYLAGWDVALLPFARNEATRFISPTKTPEYLAAGAPVVSTAIHDVVHPYGDEGLVSIASDAAGFETAIAACLSDDRVSRLARADRFLSGLSWNATFARMEALVDKAITRRRGRASTVVPHRRRRPHFDDLVVGAGFAGSVMAERLASAGRKVLLCDTRPHVGGNAYDHLDAAGILVHKYGPHIFHTNSADVFDYLSRFTAWRPYEHRVLASVDGKLLPVPINLDTVNRLYGWDLDSAGLERFFAEVAEPCDRIRNSEDVVVSKVGRELYEKFFRGYTRKQWGIDPSELDATVIARVPVRTNRDDRYFGDTYQAMPRDGYTAMFDRMLDHPNITIEVGTDYRALVGRVSHDEMIYTGPVDAFFDRCYGPLPYRSLEFRFETLDESRHLPVAVVNHPNEHAYTRVTEFKHLSGQENPRTTLVYEYPRAEGDPYYPIPRPENAALYRKYQELAARTAGVHFVGRLATYRYYNMDQVVAQALTTARKLTGALRPEALQQGA